MRRPNRFVALLASASLVVSTIAATPAAAQRVEVGNASSVVGDVKLSNASIKKPRAVVRKERIAWEDQIETGKKSQMQVLLLDRSSFGIGANSRVKIDRYVYDPQKGRSVFATIFKGALRFFSGREEGENSAEVTSPAGRIGIRGTALDMMVGKDAKTIALKEAGVGKVSASDTEATLVVLRGPAAAVGLNPGRADVEGAGKVVVLDQPGLAAFIPRNGAAPIGPFRISDAGLSKMQDQLAPSVAASRSGGSILSTLIPIAVGAIAVGAILSGGDNRPSQVGGGQNGAPQGNNQNPNPDQGIGQVPGQPPAPGKGPSQFPPPNQQMCTNQQGQVVPCKP